MAEVAVDRTAALRYRWRVQGLDRPPDATRRPTDPDVLDLGVQDSGTGGALWALANRGAAVTADHWPHDDLVLVWSLRGAPHAYRRRDLPAVVAALRPYSPADAAKRVLGAAKPLAAAGIGVDEALATVAAGLAAIVTGPTVKGEASGRLTAALPEPYAHLCRPCGVVHVDEMPFRLAAAHAGLELEPGTSPPVLRPVPGWTGDPGDVRHGPVVTDPRLDPVRGYLHHLGPARPADVARYLEAPTAEVSARWPTDAIEVRVDGGRRWLLAADVPALEAAAEPSRAAPTVHLLGPFDPYLGAKDRTTLVPLGAHRTALWPALGRPGAVAVDGEVVGAWRPRASGRLLRVALDRWDGWTPAVEAGAREAAERLAAHRGATLAEVA